MQTDACDQYLAEQSLKYTLLFGAEGNSNGSVLFLAPEVVYTVVNNNSTDIFIVLKDHLAICETK